MAVVGNAEEWWEARTSSFDGGIWTRERAWLVKTSVKTDREDVVSTAIGLPAYAEPHPADVTCYAESISYAQLPETPLAWTVTATYSSARKLNVDPEQDQILVSWSSEIYQEPIFKDVDGNAIINSAGDYFIDPSPTREASHLIAKMKVNVPVVPVWVLAYQNAVNNDTINIDGLDIAAGLAKMQRIDISTEQRRGAYAFRELSMEIHIHLEGWRLEPLDAGFRELVGGEAIQIKDSNGDEVTTPVCLNGSGSVLTAPTPSTAVFGDFVRYNELDFTLLPGIS